MTKLQIGITSALAIAGAAGYFAQTETNENLRREIATLRAQQPDVAALRAENRQLASTATEIEMLRRDDAELQRLAQRGAEAKIALEENARRIAEANARAAQVKEVQQNVQAEIARMNREGNALVEEYKLLLEKSKDPSLTAESKTAAVADAAEKMKAIQMKQREVQAFMESHGVASPFTGRSASPLPPGAPPELTNRVRAAPSPAGSVDEATNPSQSAAGWSLSK